jgi:1,2-phenylacetyl-CoA epoxidase PaaB subunit
MSKPFTIAQDYSTEKRPAIELKPVISNQIAAIGYDEETKTLSVTFTRGTGAIYHYPSVLKETHAAFLASDSIGTFFGKNIKSLPFTKFAAEPVAA